MQIFDIVLDIINWIMIGITTLGFGFQLVYVICSWMKEKHFKVSEKKNRIAIVICGRNEESVISNTVKTILEKQNYPKDKYDVFVVAHNCTDNTYLEAKNAGAYAFEYNDSDPKHAMVSYPLRFIVNKLTTDYKGKYDIMIRFDADNLPCEDYLSRMNDAFESGVKIARPYEFSKNATQNSWTKVSAAYYMRDSRLPSNFRENAHLSSMLTGAGMMVAMEVLEAHGWDAMYMSEDAEFTLNRMMDGYKVHYVCDAIVYEDQPSTFKDTFNRNKRMGHGLTRLFFKKGFRFFGHAFKQKDWSFIDLFMQLFFVPVGVLCCLWFPAYYIYRFIITILASAGVPLWVSQAAGQQFLSETIPLVIIIIVVFYVVCALQTFLAVKFSQKHVKLESLKGFWGGIFLNPVFMVVWAVAITAGALGKGKWKAIKRNAK